MRLSKLEKLLVRTAVGLIEVEISEETAWGHRFQFRITGNISNLQSESPVTIRVILLLIFSFLSVCRIRLVIHRQIDNQPR